MQHIEANFYNPSKEKKSLSPVFRQTEDFKGIYKNVKYYNDNINAEWQILNTWVNDIREIKDKKIIYLQQEPPDFLLPCKQILDKCRFTISPFKFDHPIKQYITNIKLINDTARSLKNGPVIKKNGINENNIIGTL